jgi:translocation and assembly module TamB
VPGKLFVKRESPRLNVELKTESTWSVVKGELLAEGPVELVRGTVEPISGRVFVVEHGKVQFNGAAVLEGQVDAAATWENPAATVTVTVAGPLRAPTVQLASKPALDDTSIAILIATGRTTELKAGTTDISSMDAKAASYAAGGAAFTYLFQSAVREYLPLDMVAIDSGALRAGKYLTDRFFVGYTRRFDANPELYENSDEVRVEYQISKRWTLESRYGNAQTGGASLMWQKDY